MNEFQEKVEQFKQTITDSGFNTEDVGGITDAPTITIDEPINEESSQESLENFDHQQPKQKKPGRKTVDGLRKRLEQVTFEKKVRDAQTQELLARVQDQERRLADQQELLAQNEQYKNAYYENNLQTREKGILNELKVAKEEGDVDREIKLSKDLAEVAADKSTYGFYKSQLRNQPPQSDYSYNNPPNIYPDPTYGNTFQESDHSYEEPINEAFDHWLEQNAWADPESQNYSPRLRAEANELANELDEMLRYNGNTNIIGTPAYFDSIDNLMSQRYSVKNEGPRKSETQSYSVAPVSRNGSSMADQYMSKHPNDTRRHMSLSEEEYKIARNLQIKLPNGKYATGDEAIRLYADAKRSQGPSGSQKIVID